jgi:hypothetical protein
MKPSFSFFLKGEPRCPSGAKTNEVDEMKERQIAETFDSWIAEEELPVRGNIKVIRKTDPDYGLTEDEIMDRNEYIRCYLLKDYELLMTIPKQSPAEDFFIPDCGVTDPWYSAFNTVDFQRQLRPFNKYGYAIRKIMERVKDMAILHSSISSPEGRLDTYRRYQALLERKFRGRLVVLAERFKRTTDPERRFELKGRIAELNRRILQCEKIWERYAPPENWDR